MTKGELFALLAEVPDECEVMIGYTESVFSDGQPCGDVEIVGAIDGIYKGGNGQVILSDTDDLYGIHRMWAAGEEQ